MTKVTIDRALIEQVISAIELAQDNLRPHGDNCFLHDDGEYNSCFCGLDSLTQHLQTVTETLAMSLAEPAVEPVAKLVKKGAIMGAAYDFRNAHLSGSNNLKRGAHAALEAAVDAALAETAVEPLSDDLRDRLVAISAAIADQDDRAAQAMIREILSSPSPPAEPVPVPLLSDEEIIEVMRDGNNCNYNDEGEHIDFAREIEQLVRRKVGL